jgi:N-acetylneuraminate synthase/N,N'-diacetyllegionaminate synthase
MDQLRAATGVAVGYSDHTEGGLAVRIAAGMGADVLEFHFTDSREGKGFRDHKVSVTPDEVVQLQQDIREISELRGSDVKALQVSEIEQGHTTSFRRAVYVRHTIEPGQTISADDCVVLRPNHGIDARDFELMLGARAKVRLEPYRRIDWNDLELPDS